MRGAKGVKGAESGCKAITANGPSCGWRCICSARECPRAPEAALLAPAGRLRTGAQAADRQRGLHQKQERIQRGSKRLLRPFHQDITLWIRERKIAASAGPAPGLPEPFFLGPGCAQALEAFPLAGQALGQAQQVERAGHAVVHHFVDAGGALVEGGDGRADDGARFGDGGHVAQVNKAQG